MNNSIIEYIQAGLTYWYWFPVIFIAVLGLNLGISKFFKKR